MKKALFLLSVLALPCATLGLSGCASETKSVKDANSSVNNVNSTTNQTLNTKSSTESTAKRVGSQVK